MIMDNITEPRALADYWKQQVKSWQLSGLSQAAFCKTNALAYHRFIYWRSKLDVEPEPQRPTPARSGFAAVAYPPHQDSDQGLALTLPNGLIVRGICSGNIPLLRQLLDCL